MRKLYTGLLTLLLMSIPAYAEDEAVRTETTHTATQTQTRIVTDEDTGAIRFMVEGKEVARIDAAGLHVRDSITYGGTITDVGVSSYDKNSGDGDAP